MKALENRQGGVTLTIITHRDVFQTVSKYRSQNYDEWSAVVWMSAVDLKVLGVKDDSNVKLESSEGVVVVRARAEAGLQEGFARMLVSPYANRLIGYKPSRAKLPNFKSIQAIAELTDEDVTCLAHLAGGL